MRTRVRALLAFVASALFLSLGVSAALADVHGPDVASFQHPYGYSINWSAVHSSGASFAFVKATEGTGYVNPYFTRDFAGLAAQGMVRGAYHFARPALPVSSAAAQARYFVATAGTLHGAGDLPGVLDLEVNGGLSPAQLISWTQTWLSTVSQLTGRTPILYTYPYFWQHQMANSQAFTGYPLWLASYSSSAPSIGGWSHWTFWQYTDHATLPGVPGGGSVDMSVFNGSLDQLRALANGGAAARVAGVPAGHDPVGSYDALTAVPGGLRARGWAIDPDTTGSVGLHVYLDGRFSARATANVARADVDRAYPGSGTNHGLDVTVPALAGTHQVCLYLINSGPGVVAVKLGCRSGDAGATVLGHVDVAAPAPAPGTVRVAGWATDTADPAPSVEVTVDGAAAGTATATLPRLDVAAAYPAYGGDHGFDTTVAAAAGPHDVCASVTPSAGGAPVSLGCASVTVGG